MFAGARRLDGGVQGEQVGLTRDSLNQRHDLADLLRARSQPFDNSIGAPRFFGRLGGNSGRARHLLRDTADRGGQLFGGGGHRFDICGGLRRRGRGRRGLACGLSIAAAHRGGQALHVVGGHGDRLDDAADRALEAGGEFAPCRVAVLLGVQFDLDALVVGARLGGASGFGFSGFLCSRPEQLRKLVGKPDQHARLDQQDDGVQNHAPEVGASRIDRRRKDEIQHKMMQCDRKGAGDDRPVVAIGD